MSGICKLKEQKTLRELEIPRGCGKICGRRLWAAIHMMRGRDFSYIINKK